MSTTTAPGTASIPRPASAPSVRATSERTAPRARRPRVVVAGVRDGDDPVLRWLAEETTPGRDLVHLVSTYVPVRLDGCTWQVVRDEQDHRRLAASRSLAAAVRRLRLARPRTTVTGSTVAGLLPDVLLEFSQLVDLVVVAGATRDGSPAGTGAWPVPAHAGCPVVRVPDDVPRDGTDGVVVLAVGHDGLSDEALDFAVAWAQRHATPLVVSCPWAVVSPRTPASPSWVADRQQSLDAELAQIRDNLPGLAVVVRLEFEDALPALARDAALVVGTPRDAGRLRGLPAAVGLVPTGRT